MVCGHFLTEFVHLLNKTTVFYRHINGKCFLCQSCPIELAASEQSTNKCNWMISGRRLTIYCCYMRLSEYTCPTILTCICVKGVRLTGICILQYSASFSSSKDFWHAEVHSNFASFFVKVVSGLDIPANLGTNFL